MDKPEVAFVCKYVDYVDPPSPQLTRVFTVACLLKLQQNQQHLNPDQQARTKKMQMHKKM